MIRRSVVLLAVCGMCFGCVADAADLPAYTVKKVERALKKPAKRIKAEVKAPRVAAVQSPAAVTVVKLPKVAVEPLGDDINLTWVLDPLVANSDGAKLEDSASVEANLVVTDPGYVAEPVMIIELTGHVVKTARTTARLDIRIGDTKRTVSWNADDVQSGKFKISINEPMLEGKLPDYYPVSALAFVTKDGKDGASMISLEKVVVRLGKIRVAGKQKDPATSEVTGSISTY
jgi:hypothetical protein